MGNNRIKRFVSVLISMLLVFAQIISVAGCKGKDEDGVKRVSRDSTWFNAKVTGLDGKYKNKKMDSFYCDFLGVYKDGVLIRSEGVIDILNQKSDPDNQFDNIDYYSFSGDLISSFDARELLLDKEIDDVIICDTEVVFRMHKNVLLEGEKESKRYLLSIDPETGTVGELKEIEGVPAGTFNGLDENGTFYEGTWVIGDYSVSRYSSRRSASFIISKNGKSRIVDLSQDPQFSEVSISDYIIVSETEILLVNFSDKAAFISLNLETGEVKNKDEDYKWLRKIKYFTRLSSFGGKTYVKDAYGVKYINFASKELTEVLSFNDCSVNRIDLTQSDLLYVKDERFVFARKTSDEELFSEDHRKTKDVPEIIILERADKNPNAGRIILSAGTVGSFYLEYSICEAVRVFNETNKKYYVQLENKLNILDYVDYSNADNNDAVNGIFYSGSSELSNQLATDMLSGDGPDIVLYAGDYRQIHSEEYLVDLNRYVKGNNGINEADYFSNVIDAAKVDDKLLFIPMDFSVKGILTDRSNVRDGQTGFTFDEYVKFVSEACNGGNPLSGTQLEVLTTLYSYADDSCINGKTVNFDNESFRAVCDYVKNNVNDKSFNISQDADEAYYSGLDDLLSRNGLKAKNLTLLGYPSADGRGPLIDIGISIGISASAPSSVADGAWEFIKVCLSDDVQNTIGKSVSNPLSIKACESLSKNTIESFNKANPSTKIDESIIESYKKVLMSGSLIDNTDPAVLIVIREEVPPYFVDQKSLDDILPIVNNRVKTILSERS